MAISPKRRLAILAAHGGACFYCGTPDAKHVDHIVPRAKGGGDDLGNLIPACLPCNMSKRDYRLSPDAERVALDAAEAVRDQVLQLERTIAPDPNCKVMITVMLTAEDVGQLEDAMAAERCRSMSGFMRQLILRALVARGKLAA